MAGSMATLTLTQPWATLVVEGQKGIETRSWRTTYRGPLVIHAAKAMLEADRQFTRELGRSPDLMPLGAVVGVARLVDCVFMPPEVNDPEFRGWRRSGILWPLTGKERSLGFYAPGRWAWLLADPVPVREPVAATGHQGIWYYVGPLPGIDA